MIGINLSLRARIFISMLFMILVSFLLTGLISMYHFREENEKYHQERLKRKEYAIESAIDYYLLSNPPDQDYIDLAMLFSDKVCELSDIHSLDINIYDTKGRLVIANNMNMFDQGWAREQLDEDILERINEGERQFIQPARDTSDVLMIYSILHRDTGEPLAIMNLPYFEAERIPDQDMEFLRTLFTLYMLLFLGAGILAYFLSNYITRSLTVIAAKMRNVELGRRTEPIVWNSADEIGELVEEYNRMMAELEEHAVKLAQSERDTAWKEMARQVAHEIKNPLTPMRLSVQMLERSPPANDPEKIREFAHSMISQIDALSNIATAFSRFASMPEMHLEIIDLHTFMVRYGAAHPGVNLRLTADGVYIRADRDQLTRMLNNLVINAEQAIPEGRVPKIELGLDADHQSAILTVSDNGVGIPEFRQVDIFDPSFTTKTRGMGLGLAMVRNIVKGFGGSMSLQSQEGVGTTFAIHLPRVDKPSVQQSQIPESQ